MSRGDPHAADEWRAAMARVSDLAAAAGDRGLEVTVPACPDWAARDLLAHMVGLGADVLAGAEPEEHDPAWTQSHVEARRDIDVAGLLAEWDGLADDVERYVAETDVRPLFDVVIHEQDLRGALERPGARDTAGLALVRERMAGRLQKAVADRPPVRLVGRAWTWQSADGEPGVVLTADDHDLFRALTSRRTADQLRSWTTEGDVTPYLDAFGGLGALPEDPLPE